MVSVAWPAFVLGLDPSAKIICISYSDGLAKPLSRDFRRIVESTWYRKIFPNVKLALSEGGLGWIPAALERADYAWEQRRHSRNDLHKDIRPSDMYRGHIYGCLLDDTVGILTRHLIGVDHIMFESDYPHSDSKWPASRAYAEKVLVDVPDDEAHRMLELNARELFRFPRRRD